MLFKNVLRTLQKQYVQLLLLGVIIILSSFIYTAMDYGISGVLTPTEEYFEASNQEDFAISMLDIVLEDDITVITSECEVTDIPFSISGLKAIDSECYYHVLNSRVSIIKDTYDDIDLEIRESKDVYFSTSLESFRIRFLKATSTINTSYFVDGYAPSNNDEIAVAETFAKNNNLQIGDTFTMKGKDYTVSGYVLFPDYNLPMFGTDFILDNATQTVALLTDEEFEHLEESIIFEIAGVFTGELNPDTFESSVIDTYRDHDNLDFISTIILTENNTRSGAIYAELSGGRAYTIFLSLLIASIALMIVGIMVSRVLHSQRGPIGILKSMGYTNNQITIPYIFFIAIFVLPTIAIGYFLGLLAAEPFKEMFQSFYLLPSKPIEQSLGTIVVAVIVPFIFIVGLSYFIVRQLLKQKPVTLLNPEVTSSTNFLTKRVARYLKKFKITSKLQHLLLYRSIVKFLVFLIGMFFAAYLILFSFSMNNIFDRMLYDYYDNTNHEYIAYCNYDGPCPVLASMEEVIELPSVLINDEDSMLVGLSPSSTIHPLFDNKGNDITSKLNDGLIISESLKILKGYKIGDEITIEVGEEKVVTKIVGVTDEYSGDKAYVNISDLSQTLTNNDGYYNVVYSEVEVNNDDYLVVIGVQDIIDQADTMQSFFTAFITIMVVASILIGAIIIYILTVMTIEDNFYNISLFKVVGYNNREINKMILGGYRLYGIIIFVICIPLAILSFGLMETMMGQYYNILMPLRFVWWHGLLSIVIYLAIFFIAAFAAKRKLRKISLQEAMKMYQA